MLFIRLFDLQRDVTRHAQLGGRDMVAPSRSRSRLPPLSARSHGSELRAQSSRFALPGGGGGERGWREALTARAATGGPRSETVGLGSDSRQEAMETIRQLREGARRAKTHDRQEWRKRTDLIRNLWASRLEESTAAQSPRMKGGDHRIAAGQNRPWYTAVSLTQGEKLKQSRELQWVASRVSAAQKKQLPANVESQRRRKGHGQTLQPHPPPPKEDESEDSVWTCCSWSPDGRHAVLGTEDSSAVLVDASTFDVLYKVQDGWQGTSKCCSWSPDGRHYAIGAGDCSAAVVEAATGNIIQRIHRVHTKPIQCCCFSPDGSLICLGASDGTASLINSSDGYLIHKIKMTDGEAVPVCGFSPDGLVLCLGSDVSTALLVDVSTGRPLRRITNVNGERFGPSMVTSLFHDSRLPKQMDFLESLTPPGTANSSAVRQRIRPRPAPMWEDDKKESSARKIEAYVRPETPDEFIPQVGDLVQLKEDPSAVMTVVRISDDGAYMMFRYATTGNPTPAAVKYKTLERLQKECVAHVLEQSSGEARAER
eukprot:COSAG02_NODE_922_length_15907_cov_4.423303_5_plen_540_part_00